MEGKRETSPRKAAANRANATRSTGPRTPEGKAASSRNAIRHGLLSRAALMPGEDALALAALRAELVAAVAPVGAVEELLADQLVSVVWRLRRATGMEGGTLGASFLKEMEGYGFDTKRAMVRSMGSEDTARPTDALAEGMAAGRAALRGTIAAALDRVARYGGSLERSLFRTLHELERVQARRQGQNVSPPLALDVLVDSMKTPGPH